LGFQKGKTVLDPMFLNSLFVQENREPSVAGCVYSGAVHIVGWFETRVLTMPILTVMVTDKVRCTPLLTVHRFLASVALHRIRNVWVNWDSFMPDMDGCRYGRHSKCQKNFTQREWFVVPISNYSIRF
jgi:hypothetical protein